MQLFSWPFKYSVHCLYSDFELLHNSVKCLQLGFYFMHGRLPSSFQPVNTAFYSGGRHSRLAAVTLESAAFVKAVTDGNPSDNDSLLRLLTASSDRHKIVTLETMLGELLHGLSP